MLFWLAVCASCSSGTAATRPTTTTDPHAQGEPLPNDAISSPKENAPITQRECDALVNHALDLGIADQYVRDQTIPPPTDAEKGVIRARLAQQYGDCHALSRRALECAMSAATTDALVACEKEPNL
jgi:hypothetical protein